MADSDILVTALTASQAGPGAILVAPVTSGGSCLPYLALAAVEIWGGAANNRSSATNLGDTTTGFVHGGLSASATRYYWARARDASGNYGDWYPSSATAGISATTSTVAPGPNSVGPDELKDNAVTTPKLNGGAVTNPKLGALSVGSANMQNAAIDTAHIVDAAIVRAKIGSAAVGTINIENGSVTTLKIGDAQITQAKIGNAQIVNAHLGNAIIATANIQNAAITDAKISSLSADKLTAGTLISGVTYTGALNASQVNAGTFTGLTFRTASSGNRVVISASSNTLEVTNPVGFARIGGSDTNVIYGYGENDTVAYFVTSTTLPEKPTLRVLNAGNGGLAAHFEGTGIGSTSHGARASTVDTSGGSVVLGVSQGGGGWGAFAERGGYGPFTGGHDAFIAKNELSKIGDIVCDLKVVSRNGVDDTITEVYVAEDDADPAAVGIVARRMQFEAGSLLGALPQREGVTRFREMLAERYDRLAINSVGEGQVNVCGRGGNIRAGDLIMTSTLRGKGQRQPDDIVRNYTVAKARESVEFASPDDVKRAACIYMCG